MKQKELSPHLTLLSVKVIDAGLFLKVVGTVKNKMSMPLPMVRYQIEIRGKDGKIVGHQIEEIPKLKPMEVRKFEAYVRREDAADAEIVNMAAFKE